MASFWYLLTRALTFACSSAGCEPEACLEQRRRSAAVAACEVRSTRSASACNTAGRRCASASLLSRGRSPERAGATAAGAARPAGSRPAHSTQRPNAWSDWLRQRSSSRRGRAPPFWARGASPIWRQEDAHARARGEASASRCPAAGACLRSVTLVPKGHAPADGVTPLGVLGSACRERRYAVFGLD